MEIRSVLRGQAASFASSVRPAQNKGDRTSGRAAADRLELSREWVQSMEEQRARSEAALLAGRKEKRSNGILDMLDQPSAEEQELDALSQQLKVQRRCAEIAARIMSGKRVPPQDERYLMLNDPEGYKLVLAMRAPKRNPKKWESVLEEEGAETGRSSGEETVSCEGTGEASGGDGGSSGESE